MTEPVKLLTNRTDQELAAELKKEVLELLVKVCDKMDLGSQAGLTVNFQLGKDGHGHNIVMQFNVVKVF